MSVLYLYALAADLTDLSGLVGVQGEVLSLIPFGPALAVGGAVEGAPSLDAPTLVAQDALVRSLHARAGALLPMRFGTMMPDRGAVERAAMLHEATLRERLADVRGCDQMTVRVLGHVGQVGQVGRVGPQPADSGAQAAESGTSAKQLRVGSGREYMEARAAMRAASPALDAIARSAGAWQRGVRIETARPGGLEGSVYHLIERGRADQYRAAVESAAASRRLRVLITGPSPAYAFADLTN